MNLLILTECNNTQPYPNLWNINLALKKQLKSIASECKIGFQKIVQSSKKLNNS